MPKARRIQLIKQIQRARKSVLISYVTSTRQHLEVAMAMDSVRRVYDHLRQIEAHTRRRKIPRIDLFLHSNGGEGVVPWRLVTLIREYANEFCVLVPHRAFSAATLTALGADRIIMHPMGMLGPTDPTVTNPFNPQDPQNPQRLVGISVEDVTAYFALLREDAGIQHEEEVIRAFDRLAERVHPLALGNVKRSISQSRMMARKLLGLHMDPRQDEHRINEIVDSFTSKLFYHGHPINREEARGQLGLGNVDFPPMPVENAMWRLYLDYEQELTLEDPFNIASEFVAAFPNMSPGEQRTTDIRKAKLVFVESERNTDVFSLDYELTGTKQQNGVTSVTLITLRQAWGTE